MLGLFRYRVEKAGVHPSQNFGFGASPGFMIRIHRGHGVAALRELVGTAAIRSSTRKSDSWSWPAWVSCVTSGLTPSDRPAVGPPYRNPYSGAGFSTKFSSAQPPVVEPPHHSTLYHCRTGSAHFFEMSRGAVR
jgi:hypothetical protein